MHYGKDIELVWILQGKLYTAEIIIAVIAIITSVCQRGNLLKVVNHGSRQRQQKEHRYVLPV